MVINRRISAASAASATCRPACRSVRAQPVRNTLSAPTKIAVELTKVPILPRNSVPLSPGSLRGNSHLHSNLAHSRIGRILIFTSVLPRTNTKDLSDFHHQEEEPKQEQDSPSPILELLLAAWTQFPPLLRKLPANTDLAYVVVHHLDPGHDTLLVELLSK